MISVMVASRPVVWFKTAQSSSRAPHRFDSVVMSFDQEALGMGYSKDRIWQPLCDCLHVQFRVFFASLQKVIMQWSQRERERKKEGKEGWFFFIGLNRCLTKTTCKNRKKTKARSKLISALFKLSKALTLTKPTLPRGNWSLKWRGGSVCTLKTYPQLLNGSWCPCCLGNNKIFSIQLSAPVTYGKYPRCPFNIRLLLHPPHPTSH